ncbi:interferon-induced protein 44-like [Mercenaria mercenaria]|uniref:interferon-induced protein 44-like n=1 Tax=Mercenaria mercenaria TaxID=6596 RepID=UPI00234E4F6E|nr:interferon-induced protein 44-like [Mercenaria mercenaria]
MFLVRRMFGLYSTPWILPDDGVSWDQKTYDDMLNVVATTKAEDKVQKLNFLVLGPQGHGKSSFINSIASLSKGEKTSICNAGGGRSAAGDNITTVYRELNFPGKFQWFRFCDARGLTKKRTESESLLQDLKKVVRGHVRSGYKFLPEGSIKEDNESFYIKHPSLAQRMHGVIIVFDVNEAYDIHANHIEDLHEITQTLNEMNVPVSLILTKVDDICPCVKDNMSNIYHSKKVIDAAEKIHAFLGIPKQNIYPVASFEDRVKFGWKEGLPLLRAIKACLKTAKDHLYNEGENEKPNAKGTFADVSPM